MRTQSMRFPPSFLEEIRNRTTISSVVGRRVQWDRRKSVPARGDFWACCPFHTEKTPSFHADDRKGRYYCFGCKQTGDIFTFLVEKDGLTFPEAVERLAQDAGIPMPQVSPAEEDRERKRTSLYDVMDIAAKYFSAVLHDATGAQARGYLSDRGLSVSVQQEFRLGYAPDERYGLKSELAGKGIDPELVEAAGLLVTGEDIPVSYDRFRNRIMFPINDTRGRVIAFGGRALTSDTTAKYINSPETVLFRKGTVLYNFDRARSAAHAAGTIIAVEGYMDVIAMVRAGFSNTVAPLGTALTEDQLALIWRTAPEPLLCFDGDSAGIKAAYRALDLALPLLRPGQSLRFAFLPQGKDPDDLLKAEGAEAVGAVIAAAQPLSEVLWRRAIEMNDRSTPERRAQFERELEQLVGHIADQKVREHYFSDMRTRVRALWSGRNEERRFMRPGYAQRPGTTSSRRGGGWRVPLPKSWEIAMPPSRELRNLAMPGSDGRAGERREKLILLAVLNHPQLLDSFAEAFADIELAEGELDRLRREIIDIAALEASLDAALLRDHLQRKGFRPLLERIETQFKRLKEWFVLPDAAAEDVRTGFSQMVALHRKSVTLSRELKVAEETLARHPSDENLKILNEIREQLRSAAGEEAQIEGFGEASGRPQGPLA